MTGPTAAIERAKALYGRLHASTHDLRSAQFYAGMLLKKGWHSHPWERRGTVYEQQSAYTTALVVSYGRLFVKSDGWPDFPERLLQYDAAEMALHRELKKMRNTVYAHRASALHNVRTHILKLSATEELPIDIDHHPSLLISAKDCRLFQVMTMKLIGSIRTRMDELRKIFRSRL